MSKIEGAFWDFVIGNRYALFALALGSGPWLLANGYLG